MKTGTQYYVNFVRARDGETPDGRKATLTWSPTFIEGAYYLPREVHFMPWKVWDTSALGELTLEK